MDEQSDAAEAFARPESALEQLWREIGDRDDFPAFSRAVGMVAELASADEKKLDAVAAVVLRDVSLAMRILKMANSARYRPAGVPEISTVSRALVVLGLQTVRELALASTVFERLAARDEALIEELARATFAATLGQVLAQRLHIGAEEQVFLSILFHRLGVLLALYYLPKRVQRKKELIAGGKKPSEAEKEAFEGVALYQLGQKAIRAWNLPEQVAQAMEPAPVSGFRAEELRGKSGWALSHFCFGVLERWQRSGGSFAAALVAVAEHYPLLAKLRAPDWSELTERVRDEVRLWWQTIAGPVAEKSSIIQAFVQKSSWQGTKTPQPQPEQPSLALEREAALLAPPSTPVDPQRAHAALMSGIEELMQTILERQIPSAVLLLACELLQRALYCERAMVLQLVSGGLRPYLGLALDWDRLKAGWTIAFLPKGDVFQLALQRNLDILIEDREEASMRSKIPAELLKLSGARTFLLLPIRTAPTGSARFLLYLDKPEPNQLRLSPELARLVRLVRNQIALALRSG